MFYLEHEYKDVLPKILDTASDAGSSKSTKNSAQAQPKITNFQQAAKNMHISCWNHTVFMGYYFSFNKKLVPFSQHL